MKAFLFSLAAALSLFCACAVEPDATEPTDSVEQVLPAEGAAEAAGAPIDVPAEFGAQAIRVAPGCTGNINCTGTKTCGSWTPYVACAPNFQGCHAECSVNRSGCPYFATIMPQNRSRSCVMRATGATCVEVDYRELMVSCPLGLASAR
jgi:hypothetical protein